MLKKTEFIIKDFHEINQQDYKKWVLNEHIFHSIEWMTIIKECFGINHKIAFLKNNNKIVASIPFINFFNLIKGQSALPLHFSGYSGSIVATNEIDKKEILNYFFSYCKKNKFYTQVPELSIIRGHEYFSGYSIYKMKIDFRLSIEKQVLDRANKRVRSYIKNAIDSNLSSSFGGLELLNEFYKLYLQNMKELGSPPLPRVFFKKVFNYLPQITRILLVKNQNKNCSGMFVIKVSEIELYAFSICTPRFYQTKLSSYFTYIQAIKEANNIGCSVMNFGRSIDGTGTSIFKKRYGLKDTPLMIYSVDKKWTVLNPDNSVLRYVVRIWKKLPIPLTKLGGKVLSKHII